MMGQLPEAQNTLFYEFCLETHIPKDHLLRHINLFLDFNKIKQHLKPFYSHTGRPSIDPELMIRMLLIGYCYGIRSERRLCEEINYNLAYRWFCGLGLEDKVPNHSSFSKNRHGRYRESDIFRFVFDTVVLRCHEEKLIKGEGFATDASFIRADTNRHSAVPGTEFIDWSPAKKQSPAVREYLASLDKYHHLEKKPKSISLTDPQSQWTAAKGPAQFYFSTNYLIDIEHNVIVDVEATPSNLAAEAASTKLMIQRVEDKLAIRPKRLIGDTAYGKLAMLDWLVTQKGIDPHIPAWDKTQRNDGTFSIAEFTWEKAKNRYKCPANKFLQHRKRHYRKRPYDGVTKAKTRIYRADKNDCRKCKLKSQCCANVEYRKIARSIYETSREYTRAIAKSKEYKQSQNDRKKVEVMFAHLKQHLRFNRLRLRGLSGAHDEFLLAATAQNLRCLSKVLSKPPDIKRRPVTSQ